MALPVIGALGTNVETTGTTINLALPTGVVADKGVLAFVFLDGAAQTMTWPGGWVEAENSPVNVSPTSHGLHVAWHRASGSESGNVSPTWGSSTFAAGFTARVDNMVTSGTPFDAGTGAAQSAGSNVTVSPTVTTTSLGPDRELIHVATNWSGGTWTADTSPAFTKQQQSLENVMVLCTRDQAVAGGSGNVEATCTGSDKSTAWLGALIGTTASGPVQGSGSTPFHPGAGVLNAARFYRTPRDYTIAAAAPLVLTDSPAAARPAATSDTLAAGVLLTDVPGGGRGGSAVDTLAVGVVLGDTPRGTMAGSPAGETLAVGVLLADAPPGGVRGGGLAELLAVGVALTDTAGPSYAGSTTGLLAIGVLLPDLPGGSRAGVTLGETVSSATVLTDPGVAGVLLGGTVGSVAVGVLLADVPGSARSAATVDVLAADAVLLAGAPGTARAGTVLGEVATVATNLTDPAAGGVRLASTAETLVAAVVLTDTPGSGRAGSTSGTLQVGVALADAPGGVRAAATTSTAAAGLLLADRPWAARGGDTVDTLTGGGQVGLLFPLSAGVPVVVDRYTAGVVRVVDRYTAGPPTVE